MQFQKRWLASFVWPLNNQGKAPRVRDVRWAEAFGHFPKEFAVVGGKFMANDWTRRRGHVVTGRTVRIEQQRFGMTEVREAKAEPRLFKYQGGFKVTGKRRPEQLTIDWEWVTDGTTERARGQAWADWRQACGFAFRALEAGYDGEVEFVSQAGDSLKIESNFAAGRVKLECFLRDYEPSLAARPYTLAHFGEYLSVMADYAQTSIEHRS